MGSVRRRTESDGQKAADLVLTGSYCVPRYSRQRQIMVASAPSWHPTTHAPQGAKDAIDRRDA